MDDKKKMTYFFFPVNTCEMCGSGPENHKILGQRLNTSHGFNPKAKTGIAVSVMKCKECGLIFSNPQPVPEDIQDHYGVPPESYWNEEYFKPNETYFAPQIETLKELMTISPGMKALDIGAGLGKCMITLQRAGFDAYGFEPSLPFYNKAVEKMGISPEKLKQGMMEEVEFPKEEFDFITFGAVLEHLYHPAESIKRALEWLKPGGIIHVEVPSSKYLVSSIFNTYYWLRGTNYVTHLSPMHAPFHLYEFDKRSFEQLGKRLDFEIAKHEFFVCDIFFLPSFIKPLLSTYMRWTNKGMQLSIWLKKKSV